jgi:hypothetical protein
MGDKTKTDAPAADDAEGGERARGRDRLARLIGKILARHWLRTHDAAGSAEPGGHAARPGGEAPRP